MGSLNKVMLIGRLGKDPEMRYTQSGQACCTFSMATDSKWTDKNGVKQEKTEWHRVKAWGKLAEIVAQYCQKGQQVYVEGRLETNEYTGKDGERKFSTDVVANDVQFLARPKAAGNPGPQYGGTPAPDPGAGPEDDIPF